MVKRLLDYIRKKSNPIKYAKRIGVTIGENCRLNGSPNWGTEPWLISIGDHTEISFDVAFITHDGSTWLFRDKEPYKDVLRFGRIKVGNNCFIGARSILLPGITIGDNSIVGAGSLVTKSIPSGEIWAGNPAQKISTTKEFAEKCRHETPEYDKEEYRKNFRETLLKLFK